MKRKKGVTLIQLLVALFVIAVLAFLLFPITTGVKEKVAETSDSTHMVAIVGKIATYLAETGELPPDLTAINAERTTCNLWDGNLATKKRYEFVYWPSQLVRKYAKPQEYRNWMSLVILLARNEKYPIVYCPGHLDKTGVEEYRLIGGYQVPILRAGESAKHLGATLSGKVGYFETEELQDQLTRFRFPDGVPGAD
jgi:competence protein ComGC